jgi:hypothetical protein
LPDLLARFWCEVPGYVELERDEASIEIGPPGVGFGGPQPTIVFSQTDEPCNVQDCVDARGLGVEVGLHFQLIS